ncbi:hypothetical protein EOL70_14410 [Leucothrix sargassi]|nr:hypothetical protein EOL70_14410 [Leucothrix sargassi]
MQLESITANIRSRTPWEAVDLGFSMVRTWWMLIYTPLALLLLAIITVLILAIPYDYYWVTLLILWWLKPLYHRLILHIISRKLFGETIEYGSALRELPTLIKSTGLFGELTWRRLSMSRGFLLPIWQLEQLRGKQRKQRQQLLINSIHTTAIWLNIAIFAFQFILTVSFFMLIWLLIPKEIVEVFIYQTFSERMTYFTYSIEIILVTGFVVVMVFLEPFYIAASFALYINRRTQLEAWDIEISFKRMAKRLSKLDKRLSSVVALVIASALGLSSIPQNSYAAETTEAPAEFVEYLHETRQPASAISEAVEDIKAHPDLSFEKTEKEWRRKKPLNFEDETRENYDTPDWLVTLTQILAALIEYSLWLLVIAGVIALYIYRELWLPLIIRESKQDSVKSPDILFGMDVRQASLPDDIPKAAQALWEDGKHREALSLLYRGALVKLINDDHLALEHHHTEGDILALSRRELSTSRYEYLQQLTNHWVTIAYAHKVPSNEEMQALLTHWHSDFALPVEAPQDA